MGKKSKQYYSHEATLDRLAAEDASLVADWKISIDMLFQKLYTLYELGYFDRLLCALGTPTVAASAAGASIRLGAATAAGPAAQQGFPANAQLPHRSMFVAGAKHKFEVLEFLGDSVLQHRVSSMLVQNMSFARPHLLTKLRSSCVNNATLSYVYDALSLGIMFPISRSFLALEVSAGSGSSSSEEDDDGVPASAAA
jgi:Ribonuclease III domain